jgi:hypothetical protein
LGGLRALTGYSSDQAHHSKHHAFAIHEISPLQNFPIHFVHSAVHFASPVRYVEGPAGRIRKNAVGILAPRDLWQEK